MPHSDNSSQQAAHLFSPIQLREVVLRNRIVISPMCQYQSEEGLANDWHMVHLGKFAQGGAGLVLSEATAVTRDGRITHGDLGIWCDEQIPRLAQICDFISKQGAVPGIQLSHAGRKGSAQRPWHGNGPLGREDLEVRGERPWPVNAPSAVPVDTHWPAPHAMTHSELEQLASAWEAATRRALRAGFRVLEIHGAHGYLLHQFLSPLSNLRDDGYGGDIRGRMRYPLEIVQRVRDVWPVELPLFVRISAVDGADGTGWRLEDTLLFAQELGKIGVDVVDCSSGGLRRSVMAVTAMDVYPGYQVAYAERVRQECGVRSMAVGLIHEAEHAEQIIHNGQADLVAIGREALWDPNWPMRAAAELGHDVFPDIPMSYAHHLRKRAALLQSLKTY